MSYIYSVDMTRTEYETLGDLALRIGTDFPQLKRAALEDIKEYLWNLSPGDFFEHKDLGISVYARC